MNDHRGSPPATTITPDPVKAYVGPLALHAYAADFLRAAHSVPSQEQRFSPVAYYLYCHSIELALKAFLRIKGVSVIRLSNRRHFGHDLTRLLDGAIALDLLALAHLPDEQQQSIRDANSYYSSKVFEYLDNTQGLFEALTGYRARPDIQTLRSAAEVLVASLEKPCLEAVHTLRPK